MVSIIMQLDHQITGQMFKISGVHYFTLALGFGLCFGFDISLDLTLCIGLGFVFKIWLQPSDVTLGLEIGLGFNLAPTFGFNLWRQPLALTFGFIFWIQHLALASTLIIGFNLWF
jgi:hypothetical protein